MPRLHHQRRRGRRECVRRHLVRGRPYQCSVQLAGAELIVNINESPYHAGKSGYRHEMLAKRAVDNQAIVLYTMIWLAARMSWSPMVTSELFDHDGKLLMRGNQFRRGTCFSYHLDMDPLSQACQNRGNVSAGWNARLCSR